MVQQKVQLGMCPREDSDQPTHPRRLISVLLGNPWVAKVPMCAMCAYIEQ